MATAKGIKKGDTVVYTGPDHMHGLTTNCHYSVLDVDRVTGRVWVDGGDGIPVLEYNFCVVEVDDNVKGDQIHNAARQFQKAILDTLAEGSSVVVFYVYLNKETETWQSGYSGNMSTLERLGALDYLKKNEENQIFQ
jgi:hypothetical protein